VRLGELQEQVDSVALNLLGRVSELVDNNGEDLIFKLRFALKAVLEDV
jgi:hypothetical protein